MILFAGQYLYFIFYLMKMKCVERTVDWFYISGAPPIAEQLGFDMGAIEKRWGDMVVSVELTLFYFWSHDHLTIRRVRAKKV